VPPSDRRPRIGIGSGWSVTDGGGGRCWEERLAIIIDVDPPAAAPVAAAAPPPLRRFWDAAVKELAECVLLCETALRSAVAEGMPGTAATGAAAARADVG